MGRGRDRTCDPWICSQTCICCQTLVTDCPMRPGQFGKVHVYNTFPTMHSNCCLPTHLLAYIAKNLDPRSDSSLQDRGAVLLPSGAVWSEFIVFVFMVKVFCNAFCYYEAILLQTGPLSTIRKRAWLQMCVWLHDPGVTNSILVPYFLGDWSWFNRWTDMTIAVDWDVRQQTNQMISRQNFQDKKYCLERGLLELCRSYLKTKVVVCYCYVFRG